MGNSDSKCDFNDIDFKLNKNDKYEYNPKLSVNKNSDLACKKIISDKEYIKEYKKSFDPIENCNPYKDYTKSTIIKNEIDTAAFLHKNCEYYDIHLRDPEDYNTPYQSIVDGLKNKFEDKLHEILDITLDPVTLTKQNFTFNSSTVKLN